MQIMRRIASGRMPMVVHRFPLPKGWGRGTRAMSWLDEYDDLTLRVLTGRCAPALDACLHPDRVTSYRLTRKVGGWTVEDSQVANRRRRDRARTWFDTSNPPWFGEIDAKSYYPSVLPDQLHSLLLKASAPPGVADALRRLLEAIAHVSGIPGLPIGPESSGVLGNLPLYPADLVLHADRIEWLRYSDDTWIALDDPLSWQGIVDAYAEAAANVGITLNEGKTVLMSPDEGMDFVSNPTIGYATGYGSFYVAPKHAAEMLVDEMEGGEPDPVVIRFALGALRSKVSAAGVGVIERIPALLDEEPGGIGDYLVAIARSRKARVRIDHDFLIERVCRPPATATLAGQLQAARVLAHLRAGDSCGRQLAEAERSEECAEHIPLRVWMAAAWGASSDFSSRRAIDQASDAGYFSVRRSFVGTLDRRTIGKRDARRLATLERLEPDLAPTVAYVSSSN